MPRQPLADTPGLPPYGQRSSERRKEQNRLAQRQLRERRQQQEAAQALKLHEQQNEIRRLNRMIIELKSENLVLKNQGTSRRRQSVIPISSLSRGLAMPHGTTAFSGPAGLDPASKLWYGRHSIDCTSGPENPFGNAYTSNPLNDPGRLKDWGSDDENGMRSSSNLSESTLNSTIVDCSRPLFFAHHMPDETLAPQHLSLDAGYFAHEESPGIERYAEKQSSRVISSVSSSQSHSATPWPSMPPSSKFPSADVVPDSPVKPFVTMCSQAPNASPQLNSTTKASNRVTQSISFSPIWPSSLSPDKLRESGNVEQLSSTALSGVPTDISSTNQSGLSCRAQPRKASTSGSDTSVTNSMISNSENHSPLSNLDPRSLQFPFCSQEMLSPQQLSSRSPPVPGPSPDSQLDRRLLKTSNSLICFRSPFATSPRAKRDETPGFGPLMGSEDTKRFNFNTSSPVFSPDNPNCPIDLNEIWATDF